jgi:hypothetical protein
LEPASGQNDNEIRCFGRPENTGCGIAVSDGSHVSGRWKRLTIGGTWEHIHFRENEWKGGGRLAFRILPRVSAVLYAFAPGRVEWRGGILIHPRQGD